MKSWIDQHLRDGLDNCKIESFQSADTMQKLLSKLDFALGDDSWIEDDSHIFGTLYHRDFVKCIQFLLAHLPFQAHFNIEPARLPDSEGDQIYRTMNTGNSWWDTKDQLPAWAMLVSVVCASEKTHLTNFSGDQPACTLYLTIGYIWEDIRLTHKTPDWILVCLIPRPPTGAKNIDKAWHSGVGTVLSQLRHLDITGPGLKWDWADGFQQQYYRPLAAWVGDYPEQAMVAQVSYGSCPMCEITKGEQMGHSNFQPLDNLRDQHIYSELLQDNNLEPLHTLGVHPIRNQFWQYLLCNAYCLWQLDEFHQPHLGLFKDLLHWLLNYLIAREVTDQIDNRFTSVQRYPGLQHFPKRFDSFKSGTWQGKETHGMIRTMAVNCAPNVVSL